MKIRVDTFKSTGKFYTEELLDCPSDIANSYEAFDFLMVFIQTKHRIPGLAQGALEFHVLATLVDDTHSGVPRLLTADMIQRLVADDQS